MKKIAGTWGFRRGRRGFTLTEVLLAVMIIGLIAIALASLTRASARESGVGRSKIMLRNNLSTFLRTLRQDMSKATAVKQVAGTLSSGLGTGAVVLLQIGQGVDADGKAVTPARGTLTTTQTVTYCFVRGTDQQNITPSAAYRGGKIYRLTNKTISSGTYSYPACTGLSDSNLVLGNVKYIPSTAGNYPVPSFTQHDLSRDEMKGLLDVKIITELNSTPLVNDVVQEIFAVPMGY